MAGAGADILPINREPAHSIALDDIDVTDVSLWANDMVLPYFERLRRDDPVHYHPEGQHSNGAFWSITKFHDIVAADSDHTSFSSLGSISLDPDVEAGFITMDPPKHDIQRKAVTPSVSPGRLRDLEPLIRSRMQTCLDELPIGEPFDWVDRVSIDLTGQMLATLLDFPMEDRRRLTYWSDMFAADTTGPMFTPGNWEAELQAVLDEAYSVFIELWNERAAAEPRDDLISMMAHSPAMRDMSAEEFMGNLMLLIVGGNDTTRNSMTGSVYAMHQFPDERIKLAKDPALLPSMVSETIRWQTPLAYMRRTATRDVELGGKTIRKGDKVAMWYLSGNRDDSVIDRPDEYLIDRPNPRRHLSFGFGIHRCVGNRLAELQLKILWEEIATRFPEIVVIAEPERVPSSFIHGYNSMQVVIPKRV
jgi:cytochrome P450